MADAEIYVKLLKPHTWPPKEEKRTAVTDVAILGDAPPRQKTDELEKVWGSEGIIAPCGDGSTGSFDLPGWMSSLQYMYAYISVCVCV